MNIIFQFINFIIQLCLLPIVPILKFFLFLISAVYQTFYLLFNLPLCWHDWETSGDGRGLHCRKCGATIIRDT